MCMWITSQICLCKPRSSIWRARNRAFAAWRWGYLLVLSAPVEEPAQEAASGTLTVAMLAAQAASRPILVHVTPCGRVWHSHPECQHLYHRGQRRAQLRATAVAWLKLPPRRGCSKAWLPSTSE